MLEWNRTQFCCPQSVNIEQWWLYDPMRLQHYCVPRVRLTQFVSGSGGAKNLSAHDTPMFTLFVSTATIYLTEGGLGLDLAPRSLAPPLVQQRNMHHQKCGAAWGIKFQLCGPEV